MSNNLFWKTHADDLFKTREYFCCEACEHCPQPLDGYMVHPGQLFTLVGYWHRYNRLICEMQSPILTPRSVFTPQLIGSGNWSNKGGALKAGFAIEGSMGHFMKSYFELIAPTITITTKSTATDIQDRFPHKCKRCNSPAYFGFAKMECSNKTCTGGW